MPFDPALETRIGEARARGDVDAAADALVRGYGQELHGFLVVKAGNMADDAFSLFAQDVWQGLAGFRGESSFRTWAYCIARRAASRALRGELSRRERFVASESAAERAAAHVKTTTAAFLRTEVKDRVRELRDQLSDEERELLVLRIDRGLDWNEIARVMDDGELSTQDAARRAAALRKRFERTKERLRDLAAKAGLLA